MNITEVLKQELTQWIETYWATYLKGDLKTWATFLRDDYHNIGGTKEEIWNSRQEILDYTARMLDQMKGHVEFRNRKVDVISYGSQVMLHEFTDVYIKIEGEWILYGPFRMSSLLEKTDNGWVAVHQHGSYPDMKAMEGEAFSTNALKAENARLQEAVKTRTIELEIEAALERVRSTAMGMKKPDDMLDVCRVIAAQLQQFGVNNIRNVQTAIIDENIGQYLCYQYFPAYGETTIEDTQYHKSPVENEMAKQMLVSRDGHFIGSLKGKELDEFRTHRKEENQFSDPLLEEASEVSYCFLSIGEGGLGLSLYHNMEQKDLILFRRFHQVFNLAYQRFRDIRKAEAQVREAQIEAALERVRASSMAMMDSSALSVIIYKLYEELTKLDAKLDRAFIMIVNPENQGITWWLAGKEGLLAENGFFIQNNQHPSHLMYLEKWENRTKKWQYLFEGKEKKDWDRFGFSETELSKLPDFIKEDMAAVKSVYLSGSSDQFGSLVTGSIEPLPEEQQNILSRFAAVFNQTYIRFLDLQKAEAQAREAQIEAALERVRSRSMAMHKSEELREVIQLVFEQFRLLNFNIDSAQFDPDYKAIDDFNLWTAVPGQPYSTYQHIPYFDNLIFNSIKEAKEKNLNFIVQNFSFEVKNEFFRHFFKYITYVPQERQKLILDSPGCCRAVVFLENIALAIQNYSNLHYTDEEIAVLKRFAKAFEQTYTRFLDLQKAEAQAREAQIEAALEKVRGKAMAMHNSSDLPATAIIAFSELKKLGFVPIRGGISIQNKENRKNHLLYSATSSAEGDTLSIVGWAMLDNHPVLSEIYNQWMKGEDYFPELRGDLLKSYYDQVRNSFAVPLEQTEVEQFGYFMHFTHGIFYGWCAKPVLDDDKKLLRRFTSVIDLTFKRYFDLQKSEAQAREAQIEAALEKVRSRSLAMQKPGELTEVAELLRKEMGQLGVEELETSSIYIIDKENKQAECWYAIKDVREENKQLISDEMTITFADTWVGSEMGKFYRAKKEHSSIVMKGDIRKEWINYCAGKSKVLQGYYGDEIPERTYHLVKFNGGYMGAASPGAISAESWDLLRRAASVFSLAYTRFKDLQDAAERAREAQIELALERVRSKTMAMHNSQEVGESVASLFEELVTLGLLGVEDRCGIGIMQPEEMMELWTAEKTSGKTSLTIGHLDMQYHKLGRNVYQNWLDKKETYQYILEGDDKLQYYESIRKQSNYTIKKDYYSAYEKIVHSDFYFKEGCLYVFSLNVISEESTKVFMRFASVFGQTYRRYLDLQNAEALALDTLKRSSVDRVRAEIASMRTRKDLERITPLIWRELTILGIDFIRCGVFIMDEKTEEIQTFLSTPDGNSLSTFRLGYDATGQSRQIVAHWHDKKVFKDHMDEAAFIEYTKDLVRLGAVANNEKYVTENLPKDLYLHFLPFLQGMLYVGNVSQLNDDDLELVQHLADAFSTAYARYEDFSRLEEAKAIVEAAMNELKDTQNQLVQQEKLASLGQLTAGIAHEIKNPLNFVNNFSEVSLEMLEEIAEERAKSPDSRDEGLIDEILSDVRSNLKKVHEHGTRANGIVNSMLQHSRGGTGKKEETDLNVLIKEYVNLSFHGMRAGKNPINVDIALILDEKIGWVQLIKEDFTRVIINLCNNAFDAMRSKTLTDQSSNYLPKLTVTSKKEGKTITITVRDNGPGIPDDIKEKILQPFFTTKKGTEGTGLGLSITNDIIKAHGGELNIESQVGEGTAFIIQIPVV